MVGMIEAFAWWGLVGFGVGFVVGCGVATWLCLKYDWDKD